MIFQRALSSSPNTQTHRSQYRTCQVRSISHLLLEGFFQRFQPWGNEPQGQVLSSLLRLPGKRHGYLEFWKVFRTLAEFCRPRLPTVYRLGTESASLAHVLHQRSCAYRFGCRKFDPDQDEHPVKYLLDKLANPGLHDALRSWLLSDVEVRIDDPTRMDIPVSNAEPETGKLFAVSHEKRNLGTYLILSPDRPW